MNTLQSQDTFNKPMVLALLSLSVLVLMPMGTILINSAYQDGHWHLTALFRQLIDSYTLSVLWNSVQLALLVTIVATLFAAPLAWITAKTEIGRHKWLDIVILIPFMTPPFIDSMGWMIFMRPRGYLEQLLPGLAGLQTGFFSLAGMVLIMSLSLFPFMYLVIKNSLLRINASVEEAAIIYGASKLRILAKVFLPLLISGYLMGALLVFVKTISEFGTPATLGKQIGYYVLTTEIHRFTSTWPIDFVKASVLSLVLLTTSMLMWMGQLYISNNYQYQLISGKGNKLRIIALSPWQRSGCWLVIAFILALSIGIPYFSITATALIDLAGLGLSWDNLTFKHFAQVFSFDSEAFSALLNSIQLSLYAATICTALGIWYGLTVVRGQSNLTKVIDFASLLSNTVPGIVVVFGLILFWNSPSNPLPLYNTKGMLIITYVVLFLPYTVQYVKSAAEQISSSLDDAAKVSGASEFYRFSRVTLPLILPGVIAGWAMSFIIGQRELVGSLMVKPPGFETSATFIFSEFDQGNTSLAMAMALVVVSVTVSMLAGLKVIESRQGVR
ncbi:iron ABC transporter permease [Vibrio sp. SCSIO 43140]|uniref:ABC transporter permease n=1 Tax=Vibrio sp. SCSIO 43140 TaxID=2819100 RepID=UPI0020751EFC|nr:iron ABC transporter permease [Vibrio sp. SCSIO 43140]USD61235.1 iron ABC transporter permease [Vibrio sp. SCSIO 43140]